MLLEIWEGDNETESTADLTPSVKKIYLRMEVMISL